MDEYLNKTQKEIESITKFNFKFKVRFSDLIGFFKKDKNVIKGKAKHIFKKRK